MQIKPSIEVSRERERERGKGETDLASRYHHAAIED
jgi:hypothetical protein